MFLTFNFIFKLYQNDETGEIIQIRKSARNWQVVTHMVPTSCHSTITKTRVLCTVIVNNSKNKSHVSMYFWSNPRVQNS